MAQLRRIDDHEKGQQFDNIFWEKIGPEGKFSATWQMVNEARIIRGENVSESRLQRSVQNIIRGRG